MYCPALTADLRTIVFGAGGSPAAGCDLYVAERGGASEAFGTPALIDIFPSNGTEAFPTITPDGLELLFARSDAKGAWGYSRRDPASHNFGDPSPLPFPAIPGLDAGKARMERAQFLDPLHLVFLAVNTATGSRQLLAAGRANRADRFSTVRAYRLSNPWPAYYVAPSGLRAYYGEPRGLFVCARRSVNEPFGEGSLLLSAQVTGAIEGPIWVAPKEDVMFYCSPGPGREPGAGRMLWMVRIE
ncbi:MAG: hypothetical protein ACLQNE_45475 [Thermoguttaceae bacterium]